MSNDFETNQVVEKYDAIVIGGGLGGLASAAELAYNGKKVLLLEKHSSPGGFASSFIRGRFEFECALHELNGYGSEEKPASFYHLFKKWGVTPELKIAHPNDVYRSIYPGIDVTMPFGVDNFKNKLIEEFPEGKKDIEELFKVCKKIRAGMDWLSENGMKRLPLLMKHPWLARVSGLTISEFVSKFTKDERIIGVFAQLWCFLGPAPARGSAVLLVGALMDYLINGASYPIGRSHALSSGIAESIERNGGTVRYNSLVDKIILKEGKAIGVELLNGNIYLADGVISNVNPRCTTMKMLPKNTFSPDYLSKIMSPEIGCSIFTVYLGLNGSPEEIGIDTYEVFINESFDMDEMFNASIEEPQQVACVCHNLLDPNITPPGTCQLMLNILQFGSDWHSVPPSEYKRKKEMIADKLISIVERNYLPKIRDYIEVAEVATPLTYYRYSKSIDGSIYGSMTSVFDSPVTKLQSKTEVPGLYFVGCWTNNGAGYSSAMDGGVLAANMLIEEINTRNRGAKND